MVRRPPRWRKPPPKVLSLPMSARVIECYAIEGKAYIFSPLLGETSELLLMNRERETCWVHNRGDYSGEYACDEVPPGEWRVLGWRPLALPTRHGEHDRVDPELADYDKLQALNPRRYDPGRGACWVETRSIADG